MPVDLPVFEAVSVAADFPVVAAAVPVVFAAVPDAESVLSVLAAVLEAVSVVALAVSVVALAVADEEAVPSTGSAHFDLAMCKCSACRVQEKGTCNTSDGSSVEGPKLTRLIIIVVVLSPVEDVFYTNDTLDVVHVGRPWPCSRKG